MRVTRLPLPSTQFHCQATRWRPAGSGSAAAGGSAVAVASGAEAVRRGSSPGVSGETGPKRSPVDPASPPTASAAGAAGGAMTITTRQSRSGKRRDGCSRRARGRREGGRVTLGTSLAQVSPES